MPLTHYTDRHLVKLLATQTRRTDVTPYELSRSHVALGRFLAGELVERLTLGPCEIAHPQGPRTGWQVEAEEDIALLCFLRAGFYVADGVREVLPRAPLFHVSPKRNEGLAAPELAMLPDGRGRTFVLLDSVVNTGASLEPVLQQLQRQGAARLFVLALVTPAETAARLAAAHPEVELLFARVSDNQYVGQGATDTGNRLFGTLPSSRRRSS